MGLAEHDKQIGQPLAKLDELGLAKNTIVIYTTDNGAYRYMWSQGGVRVPAFANCPGHRTIRSAVGIVLGFLLVLAAAPCGKAQRRRRHRLRHPEQRLWCPFRRSSAWRRSIS